MALIRPRAGCASSVRDLFSSHLPSHRLKGIHAAADSHRPNWPCPEGFAFIQNRKSFAKAADVARGESQRYGSFDVPGCVPIVSEPGDLILFAARTYHAVFPMPAEWDDVRRSANFGLRAQPGHDDTVAPGVHWLAPWPRSAGAKRLEASLPAQLKKFASHYPGYPDTPVEEWGEARHGAAARPARRVRL